MLTSRGRLLIILTKSTVTNAVVVPGVNELLPRLRVVTYNLKQKDENRTQKIPTKLCEIKILDDG